MKWSRLTPFKSRAPARDQFMGEMEEAVANLFFARTDKVKVTPLKQLLNETA